MVIQKVSLNRVWERPTYSILRNNYIRRNPPSKTISGGPLPFARRPIWIGDNRHVHLENNGAHDSAIHAACRSGVFATNCSALDLFLDGRCDGGSAGHATAT